MGGWVGGLTYCSFLDLDQGLGDKGSKHGGVGGRGGDVSSLADGLCTERSEELVTCLDRRVGGWVGGWVSWCCVHRKIEENEEGIRMSYKD